MTLKGAIQKDGQRHVYVKSAITFGTTQYVLKKRLNETFGKNKGTLIITDLRGEIGLGGGFFNNFYEFFSKNRNVYISYLYFMNILYISLRKYCEIFEAFRW